MEKWRGISFLHLSMTTRLPKPVLRPQGGGKDAGAALWVGAASRRELLYLRQSNANPIRYPERSEESAFLCTTADPSRIKPGVGMTSELFGGFLEA
jgi:hypothetical protein